MNLRSSLEGNFKKIEEIPKTLAHFMAAKILYQIKFQDIAAEKLEKFEKFPISKIVMN